MAKGGSGVSDRMAWRVNHDLVVYSGLSIPFWRKLIAHKGIRVTRVGRAILIMDSDVRELLDRRAGFHEAVPMSEEEKARRRTVRKVNLTKQRESESGLTVTLRKDNLTLEIQDGGSYLYHIDLEECTDSAGVLDWIFQVLNKDFMTPDLMFAILNELNAACATYFNAGVQGVFCPFAENKQVQWPKIAPQ